MFYQRKEGISDQVGRKRKRTKIGEIKHDDAWAKMGDNEGTLAAPGGGALGRARGPVTHSTLLPALVPGLSYQHV